MASKQSNQLIYSHLCKQIKSKQTLNIHQTAKAGPITSALILINDSVFALENLKSG